MVDADLDGLDRRLIAELQQDATPTHAELARRLSTSKTTVTRRVRRLLDNGVIGIAATADPDKLGLHTSAIIGLKVDLQDVDNVIAQLVTLPSVNLVLIVSGRYDVLIGIAVRSTQELALFLSRQLAAIRGIRDAESFVALEVKKYPRVGLPWTPPEG